MWVLVTSYDASILSVIVSSEQCLTITDRTDDRNASYVPIDITSPSTLTAFASPHMEALLRDQVASRLIICGYTRCALGIRVIVTGDSSAEL